MLSLIILKATHEINCTIANKNYIAITPYIHQAVQAQLIPNRNDLDTPVYLSLLPDRLPIRARKIDARYIKTDSQNIDLQSDVTN